MGEISLSDRYRRQMIARDLSDSHEGEKCDCREIVNTSLLIYCKFCCIFAGEKGTRMCRKYSTDQPVCAFYWSPKEKPVGEKPGHFYLYNLKRNKNVMI